MEAEFRKEERRQYLRFFRVWFIVIGVLAAACVLVSMSRGEAVRTNAEAPAERVYDGAGVLTDQEEADLREYIAEMEKKTGIDIVLVTINQSVEGKEAMEKYGLRSTSWEQNMQDIADDFWDEKRYGFNKGFEGDGVLLLHNWYEGQNGEHLSTSGRVERKFGMDEIDQVLYAVDDYYATDPYRAYRAYVKEVCRLMGSSLSLPFGWWLVFGLPVLAVFFYGIGASGQSKTENTVAVNAYVAGGKPELRGSADDLLRQSVTHRKIETSSGGSGGRSGGGGGHHTSSSGASHGGGSHRH